MSTDARGSRNARTDLYTRLLFPRACDLVMRLPIATRYRRRVIPRATGRVLEIGMGSGLNLPFYGPHVAHVFGLEPSPALHRIASRRARLAPFPVDVLEAAAEAIPLEDASVDTVVSTWTLCTVADPARALSEMRRVLKPGGRLVFVEHGLAPDPTVRRWQHGLNRVWQRVAGGCHLNRKVDEMIAAAGWNLGAVDTDYAGWPRTLSFMYCGEAGR